MKGGRRNSVILIGAGGHAKVLAEVLISQFRNVIGILDPIVPKGRLIFGIPVLGDDSAVVAYEPGDVELVNGIGSVPGKDFRWSVARSFREKGYRFTRVIHPSSIVSKSAVLAAGVQVMAGCVLQTGASIGQDTIVNTHASVDHDCIIGSDCHIAPGVTLGGGVRVGERVHIGTGSSVIENIEIGAGAVIGAGSVIYRNVLPGERVIQKRSEASA